MRNVNAQLLSDILNKENVISLKRDYNGLSAIGKKCHRELQFQHYWFSLETHTQRIKRLFQVGHDSEHHMIADLARMDIHVTDQQKEVIGSAGHWKGHIDGIISNLSEEYLAEFKTHNDKSFKDLLKKKVMISKPGHYDQMQSYMGYLGILKALYMAENKNDSTYYFEIVEFDQERFDILVSKEVNIITTDHLLPRIGNNSKTWFECGMCNEKDVCFGDRDPAVTCRSCTHVDVLDKGVWKCDKFDNILTTGDQRDACNSYEFNKHLEIF